jgi:UDP-N-acetylglucosamine acyltransferase
MVADGNPAEVRGINQVGLERHHFSTSDIRNLREAYKIIYRSGLNTSQALEALHKKYTNSPLIEELMAFISNSKRGIVR